ncbi:hypothetical protein [Streptomyces sp. RB17]|uniref:hypothetical protein n=1 Tax=Streptomyces sp. RB17 TaxID=2585197 RepID=UPI001296D6A1|nr:hypothetical protein [Streptomyces sp. RB17]
MGLVVPGSVELLMPDSLESLVPGSVEFLGAGWAELLWAGPVLYAVVGCSVVMSYAGMVTARTSSSRMQRRFMRSHGVTSVTSRSPDV